MIQIIIGGELLGEVYVDRTGDEPKTLDFRLDRTERRVRVIPAPSGSTEAPSLQDLGRGLVTITTRVQRVFDTISDGCEWVLQLADAGGVAGPAEFRFLDGRSIQFPYAVANVGGTESIGALVRLVWSITVGKKFVC